jgi:hypothetical protein
MERMRIDLDGVPLKDPQGRVLCIFRFRTLEGLVLALPESIDVVVSWSAVAQAEVNLIDGKLKVVFSPTSPQCPRWLGEFDTLEGDWTDRQLLVTSPHD